MPQCFVSSTFLLLSFLLDDSVLRLRYIYRRPCQIPAVPLKNPPGSAAHSSKNSVWFLQQKLEQEKALGHVVVVVHQAIDILPLQVQNSILSGKLASISESISTQHPYRTRNAASGLIRIWGILQGGLESGLCQLQT